MRSFRQIHYNIQIYESIGAFHINKKATFISEQVENGGAGDSDDFRLKDNPASTVFEKVEQSLNIQTMNRSKVLQGTPVKLVDKELGNDEAAPVAVSSARITGEVQYESSEVFTLVPDVKDSLFRDAPPAANLQKVSDMDILTVDNSHKMLTSIDGALKRVDAERGDLGATMNRMGHTIDNLGNIVVNSSAARSRIEDADMAMETAELAKSQILQQAATAMLAQANLGQQGLLQLIPVSYTHLTLPTTPYV